MVFTGVGCSSRGGEGEEEQGRDRREVRGRGGEHFRLPWEAQGLALPLASFSFLST